MAFSLLANKVLVTGLFLTGTATFLRYFNQGKTLTAWLASLFIYISAGLLTAISGDSSLVGITVSVITLVLGVAFILYSVTVFCKELDWK